MERRWYLAPMRVISVLFLALGVVSERLLADVAASPSQIQALLELGR